LHFSAQALDPAREPSGAQTEGTGMIPASILLIGGFVVAVILLNLVEFRRLD
jgi:hypothetical protein